MAFTKDNARDKVKEKLDIVSDTSFDTIIASCVEQATGRLAPFFLYDMPEDVSVTLDIGDDTFDLPDTTSTLEQMYIRSDSNDVWRYLDLWRQHNKTIYIGEPINTSTSVKLLAKRPFAYSDADFTLLPEGAKLPLYLFTMSEFATYLSGNKRKFNIYVTSTGNRTFEEMQDWADFLENRAVRAAEQVVNGSGL